MAATTPRKIKSAERTLALFELFARDQQPFTVGRIAEGLNIPQPSASMLLRNLLALGYLEYDARSRTFTPSVRVALLGCWVDRRFGDAGAIAQRLDELRRKVGHTAYISIQNGAAAQYVLAQNSEAPNSLDVASGTYKSLTRSAAGRILMSQMPDSEVLSWTRRCNSEAAEDWLRVREGEFLDLICSIRAQGYAETKGDLTPGMGAIAISFASPMGRMPLAVCVGGPIPKIQSDKERILEALREFTSKFGHLPKPEASLTKPCVRDRQAAGFPAGSQRSFDLHAAAG